MTNSTSAPGNPDAPLRLLFLCTGNSARSQIAEALANSLGAGRIFAASAGTSPVGRVNPYAVEELARRKIDWRHAAPKDIDTAIGHHWDLVITVCDNARESCPVMPGATVGAHWGMPDPAAVSGDEETIRRAFQETALVLERRIRLLLDLDLHALRSTPRTS